jgi:eukaryotic-like serine/threonine-protein kinase
LRRRPATPAATCEIRSAGAGELRSVGVPRSCASTRDGRSRWRSDSRDRVRVSIELRTRRVPPSYDCGLRIHPPEHLESRRNLPRHREIEPAESDKRRVTWHRSNLTEWHVTCSAPIVAFKRPAEESNLRGNDVSLVEGREFQIRCNITQVDVIRRRSSHDHSHRNMTTAGNIQTDTVIAGRYRIERVLGRGGMGVVVQATHLYLHQLVAIKFLLPDVLHDQRVVQRFLQEAQAAVRLRSEHVARVMDVGMLDNGLPYLVLEYLEGTDLANVPRSQLTVGRIVDLMLQACEALAEAHALGIVHRDIKPGNLFVTRRADGAPLLKVLDFGISKLPMKQERLTASQTVMGTSAYMSPEQMRSSRNVDQRSDIWSLGVVLHELIQGEPLFKCDELPSMVLKVVHDTLPQLTVQVPTGLDAVVYRCLEKDPARRFQNIAELARALAGYAQSAMQAAISVQRTSGVIGAASPRAVPAPRGAGHVQPTTISGATSATTVSLRDRSRWKLVVAAGALLGALVLLIASLSRHSMASAQPPSGPGSETGSGLPVADAAIVPDAPRSTTAPALPTKPMPAPGSDGTSSTGPQPPAPGSDGTSSTGPQPPAPEPPGAAERPALRPAPSSSPTIAHPPPASMAPPPAKRIPSHNPATSKSAAVPAHSRRFDDDALRKRK